MRFFIFLGFSLIPETAFNPHLLFFISLNFFNVFYFPSPRIHLLLKYNLLRIYRQISSITAHKKRRYTIPSRSFLTSINRSYQSLKICTESSKKDQLPQACLKQADELYLPMASDNEIRANNPYQNSIFRPVCKNTGVIPTDQCI